MIAHEYEFGSGGHMAASRSQVDWFLHQAGILSFRAFAQGKASWILNYSWDGEKGVTAPKPMNNLANSIVMAGANFLDALGQSMSGSNDLATRKLIRGWIEKNEQALILAADADSSRTCIFLPEESRLQREGISSLLS